MKRLTTLSIILLLVACGGQEQTENTQTSETAENPEIADNEAVETTVPHEISSDNPHFDLLIGKWEYQESITAIGDQSMSMKAVYKWEMEYFSDGTYYEMQQLIENGDEYIEEGPFTLDDNTLNREGLMTVTISELDETTLKLENLGSSMVFKKVK